MNLSCYKCCIDDGEIFWRSIFADRPDLFCHIDQTYIKCFISRFSFLILEELDIPRTMVGFKKLIKWLYASILLAFLQEKLANIFGGKFRIFSCFRSMPLAFRPYLSLISMSRKTENFKKETFSKMAVIYFWTYNSLRQSNYFVKSNWTNQNEWLLALSVKASYLLSSMAKEGTGLSS